VYLASLAAFFMRGWSFFGHFLNRVLAISTIMLGCPKSHSLAAKSRSGFCPFLDGSLVAPISQIRPRHVPQDERPRVDSTSDTYLFRRPHALKLAGFHPLRKVGILIAANKLRYVVTRFQARMRPSASIFCQRAFNLHFPSHT
jgi:hypothetical protein